MTWLNSAESSKTTNTSVSHGGSGGSLGVLLDTTTVSESVSHSQTCVTCLKELGENICHSEGVLYRGKPRQLFDGLPPDLETHHNTGGVL